MQQSAAMSPASPSVVARVSRKVLGSVKWALGSSAGGGAAALGLLFAIEIAAGVNLQMMGVHDVEVQRKLVARFGPLIVRQQLSVLGFYLALGALLGGGVGLALAQWDRVRDRKTSRRRRWLLAAVGALTVEGWRLAVGVIRYPQLFAENLYAHGGARRTLQILLTDHVPRWSMELVGWLAIAALISDPQPHREGVRGS